MCNNCNKKKWVLKLHYRDGHTKQLCWDCYKQAEKEILTRAMKKIVEEA